MQANTSYLFVPTEFTEPTVLGSRAAADDSLKGLHPETRCGEAKMETQLICFLRFDNTFLQ